MSDEDSFSESSTNAVYVSLFCRHLTEVRAHLSESDREPLLPSYIPPTGYWTASEKDTFFHALCTHSRFRPDLIAACIKTKTILDVCAYLDALDEALSRDHPPLPLRTSIEGAMEVSDSWVRWEEKMATSLASIDCHPERSGVELSTSNALSRATAAKGGMVSQPDPSNTGQTDTRRQWDQENISERLDSHHLKAMDRILMDAESRIADPDGAQENQMCQSFVPPVPSLPTVPPSGRTLLSPTVSGAALLPLSSVPVLTQPLPESAALETPVRILQHRRPSSPHSPLVRDTAPPEAFRARSLPNASPTADPSDILPQNLSPTTRRRFNKRLYMRRKRAELRGEEASTTVAKLRPGRRIKQRLPPKPRPKKYNTKRGMQQREGDDNVIAPLHVDDKSATSGALMNPDSIQQPSIDTEEAQDDIDKEAMHGTDIPEYASHSKSGLTKPYRIKNQFEARGIDASTLVRGDLGLFHLTMLSRLMELYKSNYDETTTTTATSISADAVRLMTAIIVEFTSEVIYRTIISTEQDKKMKGDIKVWGRIHDEITPEHVNHILKIMGMKGWDRAKYFAGLLGEKASTTLEGEKDGGSDSSGAENDVDDDDSSSCENLDVDHAAFPALLPVHRELNPPFIRLPGALALPSSTRAGTASPSAELSLMPVDTDEDELLQELEEELHLDEADTVIAKQFEAELWETTQGRE